MSLYEISTRIHDIHAEQSLTLMLQNLREHDLSPWYENKGWHVDYAQAKITLSANNPNLCLTISAPSRELLHEIKMHAFYEIITCSKVNPNTIIWQGDIIDEQHPPTFRVITVTDVFALSPHMQRVRFKANDLEHYESHENIHCKLFFPQIGLDHPKWPTLGANGELKLPTGDNSLESRTYTIRKINAKQSFLEVDFVLHEEAGPGSTWASQAHTGQSIGMMGPGGRTAKVAEWMLLAGDETALPAIARIAESLPQDTQGIVLIEVQNSADKIALTLPKSMTLQYLLRHDILAGRSDLLSQSIKNLPIPTHSNRFVWLGAEFSTVQTIRTYLRDTLSLNNKEQLLVAYWRYGASETAPKK